MFFYYHHRKGNIIKKASASATKVFEKVHGALTESSYTSSKEQLAQLKPSAIAYLPSVVDEQQYIFPRLNLGYNMYGRRSSQFVEAMNYANIKIRKLKADFCSALKALVETEADRFQKTQTAALARYHPLTESAKTQLEEITSRQGGYSITNNTRIHTGIKGNVALRGSSSTASIGFGEDGEHSDVMDIECTCGSPKFRQFPCAHVIALARHNGLTDYTCLIPAVWKTTTWANQYRSSLTFSVPSDDTIQAQVSDNDPVLFQPLGRTKKKGRPKQKRIRSSVESIRSYSCGLCRETGHRANNCPKRLGNR